ncbi:putative rhamnosyl transferase [Tateyamaria omphalii]|uniref:putative rhamnosyl transferase n=1 Tax=Tateyamaria omphalii TaxID=299262 RepID=UPI001C99697C|nr:putative rhamnosyl transferase [Tateyamaria omphalii]MBY5935159.1 putative rhamnosyl transferase [Tateyamaria omphalii]
MQIIGLCRFSYPAIGGFQVGHETIEDRMDYLWAHDRLEERFRLLETMALPCLRAQTDQDFDLIMLIGDTFPKQHEDRLRDLTADMPQVQIIKKPPLDSRPVCKDVLNAARRDIDKPCIQFRHDDDDACAVDFIEKLRNAAHDARSLCRNNKTVAFDWNQGYVAEVGAHGIAATEIYRPFYVSALGVYIAGGVMTSIHNFMHERIPQFMPCVTYSDKHMFVRTHNGYNDSRQKKVKDWPVEPLSPEQERLFKSCFNVDVAQVRSVFSAP